MLKKICNLWNKPLYLYNDGRLYYENKHNILDKNVKNIEVIDSEINVLYILKNDGDLLLLKELDKQKYVVMRNIIHIFVDCGFIHAITMHGKLVFYHEIEQCVCIIYRELVKIPSHIIDRYYTSYSIVYFTKNNEMIITVDNKYGENELLIIRDIDLTYNYITIDDNIRSFKQPTLNITLWYLNKSITYNIYLNDLYYYPFGTEKLITGFDLKINSNIKIIKISQIYPSFFVYLFIDGTLSIGKHKYSDIINIFESCNTIGMIYLNGNIFQINTYNDDGIVTSSIDHIGI